MIETYDKPDSQALRRQLDDAHLDFLEQHKHLLLACGAKRTDDAKRASGGLYLLDVDTRQAAATFIAADPFSAADLFERVVIVRWSPAYLNGRSMAPRRRSILRRPTRSAEA